MSTKTRMSRARRCSATGSLITFSLAGRVIRGARAPYCPCIRTTQSQVSFDQTLSDLDTLVTQQTQSRKIFEWLAELAGLKAGIQTSIAGKNMKSKSD